MADFTFTCPATGRKIVSGQQRIKALCMRTSHPVPALSRHSELLLRTAHCDKVAEIIAA
jgi:hypothetical protein